MSASALGSGMAANESKRIQAVPKLIGAATRHRHRCVEATGMGRVMASLAMGRLERDQAMDHLEPRKEPVMVTVIRRLAIIRLLSGQGEPIRALASVEPLADPG